MKATRFILQIEMKKHKRLGKGYNRFLFVKDERRIYRITYKYNQKNYKKILEIIMNHHNDFIEASVVKTTDDNVFVGVNCFKGILY